MVKRGKAIRNVRRCMASAGTACCSVQQLLFLVPIHDVVIFVNRDDGWVLMQNSWNTVTEAYTLDAENYCQTFKSCAGRGVSVRMAPAESHSRGQQIARELVEAIIQTPA